METDAAWSYTTDGPDHTSMQAPSVPMPDRGLLINALTHVGHVKIHYYGFRAADFFNPYFSLFLQQTEVGKGKMYIQVKLHHCAFYQYNHCYINNYLDEDSAPTIVPTIKGLNWDVGLHGKT